MTKVISWLAAAMLLCLLAACSDNRSPQAVTQQFWRAVAEGDLDTAKSLATAGSMDGVTASGSRDVGNLQFGEVREQDGAMLVATLMEKSADNDAVELSFDTVLEMEDGQWRVNFNRTVQSMVGSSVAQLRQAISEKVNEMGDSIGEAVDEMLNEAVEEMNQALQGAAEEMQKAADELRKETRR